MSLSPSSSSVPGGLPARNHVLLVGADGDCEALLRDAAAPLGLDVVAARDTRDAFRHLRDHESDFSLIVIDVDPGVHGVALLEAVSACAEKPPMLVLTSLELEYMKGVARDRGAIGCLGKPTSLIALEAGLRQAIDRPSGTSDYWGHLIAHSAGSESEARRARRGITGKLSAKGGPCQ